MSALGDPLSLKRIAAVMRGRASSLLELDDRPAAYDDVGRLCTWGNLFPVTLLSRSRYERVLSHAISGQRVRIEGAWHRPVGMRGWTHVVFRRERDGARQVRSLDDLLVHLAAWDRSANRRVRERRVVPPREILADRRVEERRVELADTRRESEMDDAHAAASDVKLEVTPNADQSVTEPARAQTRRQHAESPLVIVARI